MKKVFFVLLVMCSFVEAADVLTVKGKITNVATHADAYATYDVGRKGLFFIFMDELDKACGSAGGFKRAVISEDHPLYNTVVSMALTAHTTQKNVSLSFLNECTIRGNSWDFAILSVTNS